MAIVRPSFNCTLKSNHPAAEAFYPILPVINDGEGSVMLLESKRGSSDGTNGTITFTVSYDDDFSNQRLLYLSHTNVAVGSSVSSELKLTGIDFSKSNIRCITAKTNQVDVIPSEFTMAIWKPEIVLNSFHAYRSDGDKNASTTGQYVTVEGNVSFDLPNLEAITNIGGTLMPLPSGDFSPVGQYRFKITDGENTIYSDYAYVTNQGTLESYQNTKNGIEFSEVINCSTINLDSANISIETEIVSEIGGIVGYEGDGAEVLMSKNVYFHMSPNGRGLGIGGIPMHGNYKAPALDIHWPVYLKQFFSNGINMTLSDETIALWSEILGGGVTLDTILAKLAVPKSVICARIATQQTLKNTYAKIVFGTTSNIRGDGFTLQSDGGIKINRDMYALVSGNLYSNRGLVASDTVFIAIYLNGASSAGVYTQKVAASGANGFPITPCPMNLQAGDVVHIYAYNSVAARGVLPAYYQNRIVLSEL